MNTALKRDLTRTSFIDTRVSYSKEIAIPVTFIWDKSVWASLRGHKIFSVHCMRSRPLDSGACWTFTKLFLTFFVSLQNLVVAPCHTMWVYVGVTKIWEHWGPAPLGWGVETRPSQQGLTWRIWLLLVKRYEHTFCLSRNVSETEGDFGWKRTFPNALVY